MPTFDHSAPTDLGRSGYRLLRTPAASPLTGYVLSDNLVGCKTHFVGNRTIPCESPNCDPCDSGIAWRWHGYLLVILSPSQETVIFEMTAIASAAFADYYKRYGTTRGAAFKAQRVNGRHNGRVLIQAKPADLAKVNLPKAVPLQKLLCHIWNIPPNQVTTPDTKPRPPFQDTRIDRSRTEQVIPLDSASAVEAAIKLARKKQAGNGRTAVTHSTNAVTPTPPKAQ